MIDLLREEEYPQAPAQVLVRVTNRNPFIIKDRFDGVPVQFRPNEQVTISPAQAAHFFGYPGDPQDMAIHMAKRYMWNTAEHIKRDPLDGPDGPTLYQKYAWSIQFEEQEFELVPRNSKNADDGLDTVEDLPAGKPPPMPAEERTTSRAGAGKHTPPARRRPGRPRKTVTPAVPENPNFATQ